jgi:myo-inositol catabolism protein IolS
MKYRDFGRTGEKISELVLGTWTLGDGPWRDDTTDEQSIRTIHAALDHGITMVDTAEIYGRGRSEEVVGMAAKGRRDKVHIATKVWRDNLTREGVEKALDASLRRLDTDYVDLYQIHRPSADVPIEETMGALLDLQKAGKIRWIGTSNFSAKQMEDALKIGRFESSQPPYSLFWRFVEKDDLPFCEENDISVIPWSSLAQGILAGKYDMSKPFPSSDGRINNFLYMEPTWAISGKAITRMREVAAELGCEVAHLSLAWMLRQPGMAAPIVGPRTVEQVEGLLPAVDLELSDDVMTELDALGNEVMDSLHSLDNLHDVYEMWPQ